MDYRASVIGLARALRLAMAVLAFTATATIGRAETADNPYRIIAQRNAFGLRDATVVSNVTTEVVVKTDIKLTGIAKVNGIKRAYLAVPNTDPKAAGQLLFYELKENRPDDPNVRDGIEVVEIDEVKQTVKVRQGANEMVLDFDKNGFKAAGAPAPPAVAGRPGAVPLIPGAPAANPAAATAALAPVIISRGSLGTETGSASAAPAITRDLSGQEAARVTEASSPLTRIPTRQVRTPAGSVGTPIQAQEGAAAAPQMTPEQQYLHMEAVRRAAEQRGIPLPPTPPLPGVPPEANPGAAVPQPGS